MWVIRDIKLCIDGRHSVLVINCIHTMHSLFMGKPLIFQLFNQFLFEKAEYDK